MYNYYPISEQTSRRYCVLGFGTRTCDSATSTYSIIMFLMNRPCGRSPNSRAQPIYPPSVSNLSCGFSNYASINMARRQQFDSCMRSMRSTRSISLSREANKQWGKKLNKNKKTWSLPLRKWLRLLPETCFSSFSPSTRQRDLCIRQRWKVAKY